MKTLIINGDASVNKTVNGADATGRSLKLCLKAFIIHPIAALTIIFVLSAQLVSAQNASASTSFSGHTEQESYLEKLTTRNADAQFLTTRLPDVLIKSNITNENNSSRLFKGRFNAVKHTGFGLLSHIMAFTKVPLAICTGGRSLKAHLSLKTDRVAIEPKGPGNFHYTAISFSIKF